MQEIFKFVRTGTAADGTVQGHFQATGVRPRFLSHLTNLGVNHSWQLFRPLEAALTVMANFNSIYLFYLFIGLSAAMFAEGVYLLVYSNASYRKNINRRLKVMSRQDRPRKRTGAVASRARFNQRRRLPVAD